MELLHVSIHNQYDESSIEELSNKGSFYDCAFLLWQSILTDPCDKQYNDLLKNDIDTNDDTSNGKARTFDKNWSLR